MSLSRTCPQCDRPVEQLVGRATDDLRSDAAPTVPPLPGIRLLTLLRVDEVVRVWDVGLDPDTRAVVLYHIENAVIKHLYGG